MTQAEFIASVNRDIQCRLEAAAARQAEAERARLIRNHDAYSNEFRDYCFENVEAPEAVFESDEAILTLMAHEARAFSDRMDRLIRQLQAADDPGAQSVAIYVKDTLKDALSFEGARLFAAKFELVALS